MESFGTFAATEGRRFGQRRYRGERCLSSRFVSDLVGQLTYILEWLGQDIKRRTRVVRNFPNAESRLRLAKNSVITTVAAACCSALPGHVGQIRHVVG
jgi:hypothetical protein